MLAFPISRSGENFAETVLKLLDNEARAKVALLLLAKKLAAGFLLYIVENNVICEESKGWK